MPPLTLPYPPPHPPPPPPKRTANHAVSLDASGESAPAYKFTFGNLGTRDKVSSLVMLNKDSALKKAAASLMVACRNGHTDAAKLLLVEPSVNPNFTDVSCVSEEHLPVL
jgi:hypothetical protein